MDASAGLNEEFRRRWPDADFVQMSNRLHGAVRSQRSVYEPEGEDLPESVSTAVREISMQFPDVRFVLLRTECWEGMCSNWVNSSVVANYK